VWWRRENSCPKTKIKSIDSPRTDGSDGGMLPNAAVGSSKHISVKFDGYLLVL